MVRENVDNVDATKYSPEVIEKIQGFTTPYFVRTMYDAMVFNGHSQGGCHMELPAQFVKEHGDKFHTSATLEGPTGEEWKVRLRIQVSSIQARVSFATGWREFSQAHQLERGDLLLFSVIAESKFVVFIFSQAGKLVQRRHTHHPLRHRQKFPSRTLKLSDNDSNPSSSPPPSSKRKAKGSRQPDHIKKQESSFKARVKRKGDDDTTTRSKKKKRRGKQRYSETEAFKLLEEVARGDGKVSHVVNGRLVAWKKVDDDLSSSDDLSSPSPLQSGPRKLSPRTIPVSDVAEANAATADDSDSWPTWLQLFGLNEQEQSPQI